MLFSYLFLEPFLNNGMMFVSFHSKGTTPSFNDKLDTLASGVLICYTVSINSFGRIPSTPGDVVSFIVFIFLATISGISIVDIFFGVHTRSTYISGGRVTHKC